MAQNNIAKNVVKKYDRWYLRKMLHGRMYNIDLYASNKDHAVARARVEWKKIRSGTWNDEGPNTAKGRKRIPTVGELRKPYLDAALACSDKGRVQNFADLCRIIGEALGITKKEVLALPVDKAITPEVLAAWIKVREARPPRLTKAERAARDPHEISKPGKLTPLDLNRVRGTIISTITHARAVFCEAARDPESGYLRSLNIPELKGFLGVVLPSIEERVWRVPHEAKIDCVVAALPDLEKKSPAVFIGILLGLGMGLRRGEIINARWSQFFWENKVPKIKLGATHDWKGTKGKRERSVPIPLEVYAKLLEHKDNETYLVPDKREAAAVVKTKKGKRRVRYSDNRLKGVEGNVFKIWFEGGKWHKAKDDERGDWFLVKMLKRKRHRIRLIGPTREKALEQARREWAKIYKPRDAVIEFEATTSGHFSTQRPGRGETGPNAYRKSTSGVWGMAADCNRWLTSVGWDRRQKLHEMRKYFGAMVVTETGSLYEAQVLLGHQRVETTRDAYAGLTKQQDYTSAIDSRLGLASTG